jgi:DMSO/TMAO reductase YedYZ molybdopterin-dependent catalytic subunit
MNLFNGVNKWTGVILLMLLAACLMYIAGCTVKQDTGGNGMETIQITEYQGENLSSINEFTDNSIKGPQKVDKASYRLVIDGLVSTPQSLTYDQAIGNYQDFQKVVQLDCVEGWSVKILWDGVSIRNLLDTAGIKPEANTVIFHAADGYTTSLPLDYIIDNNIILAYKMNGVTIPQQRGFPFMVVAESKWGYKWAKWVTRIELSSDPNYKGYWEQRGYSNNGDLDQEFFAPR